MLPRRIRSGVGTPGGAGRPQGIGFDSAGSLYVVDALAGLSGMYRLHDHDAELVLSNKYKNR